MKREELQTWALVGGGAVIIVLLLLDFGTHQATSDPALTGNGWTLPPTVPDTFQINIPPPGGWPFYLTINNPPPAGPGDYVAPGTPCGCGCSGDGTTILGPDLNPQIQALNQAIQDGQAQLTASYYAGYPAWVTNDSQISIFNQAVGLPPPF